jgi:general secretion pathway protein D
MPTHPIRTTALALALALLGAAAHGQYPGVVGSAEREQAIRNQKKAYAAGQIAKADAEMSALDFESAYSLYKSAVDSLPPGGTATADVRQQALSGFCNAAVQLARQRTSEGRYADARLLVEKVLEENYDPNYGPALALRARLLDPQGFVDRGTLTPGHVAKIEEVKKLIKEGEGYYATGRYDLAFKRCEQALNVDKYNIAARKLMEKINAARQKYAEAAYNETRGDMLMQVSKAWELPLRRFTDGPTSIIEQPEISFRGTQSISNKLDSIIIPRIDFTDASIREALDFIKKRSIELDTTESDPSAKGINIVLKLPPDSPDYSFPITLSLTDVPLRAGIDYIARAANLKIKVDPFAVVVVPQTEDTDILVTKEYKVPPGFIQATPGSAPGGASASRSLAKDFLEGQGVSFPTGASANFIPSTSRLIVKNTQSNLDLIDALVDTSIATRPTQVEIEAKFLEVTQNNLNELGFDWLIGQFALAGGSGVYGSGGTMGLDRTINSSAYPLVNPASGLPVGASSSTAGPITAGNRGGAGGNAYSTAISLNAVDALLLGSQAGVAPGILSVAGVFTNPQFQVVLRALSQKKGIDLVSAPRVTTQSGKRATIEIIREFRYPTDFQPPQLSATFGSQYTPVVPNNPTSWDTKPTGITLEVEPTVGADAYTIELVLEPRVIEFDGFINYGSPINASVARSGVDILETISALVAIPGLGPSFEFEATSNTINQPVFSIREISTQVSIYDGQTVALGGLMREDVQKVQDKVPILGDIPLAGRLFRSNVDQHIKRNLIMFVTAGLLDPAGQPIIKADEEDEIIPVPDLLGMLDEAIPGDILTAPLPQ